MEPGIAPSAQPGVSIGETAIKLCDEDFFKDDYEKTTKSLISDNLSYEEIIDFYRNLMKKYFA